MNLILRELDALAATDEVVNPTAPNVDAAFVELLRRLRTCLKREEQRAA